MEHLVELMKAERDALQAKVDALGAAIDLLDGHEPAKAPPFAKPAPAPVLRAKKAKRSALSDASPKTRSPGAFRQPKNASIRWTALNIIRQQRTITSNKLVELLKPQFPEAYKDSVNASLGYDPRYPVDVDKRKTEPWIWTWNQDKCDRNCAHWSWPLLDEHCECRHPKTAHDGSGKCVRPMCDCRGYEGKAA